jgi:hypothetical protein
MRKSLLQMLLPPILVLAVLWSTAAAGVSITYNALGSDYFTLEIADRWLVNVGAEPDISELDSHGRLLPRLVTAMPGDGMPLWFGIWVPPDLGRLAEVADYMKSLGDDLLKDVKVKKRRRDVLNAMEVVYVSGTGKKEGETMDFYAAYVQLDEDSVVIALYIGPPATTAAHADELRTMIESLQPVAGEQP